MEVPKHLPPLTCLSITTASTSGPDSSLSSQILLPFLLSTSLPSCYLSQDACETKPLPQQSRCRSPRALLSLFVPSLVCPPPPLPPYLPKTSFRFILLPCTSTLPHFNSLPSPSLPRTPLWRSAASLVFQPLAHHNVDQHMHSTQGGGREGGREGRQGHSSSILPKFTPAFPSLVNNKSGRLSRRKGVVEEGREGGTHFLYFYQALILPYDVKCHSCLSESL